MQARVSSTSFVQALVFCPHSVPSVPLEFLHQKRHGAQGACSEASESASQALPPRCARTATRRARCMEPPQVAEQRPQAAQSPHAQSTAPAQLSVSTKLQAELFTPRASSSCSGSCRRTLHGTSSTRPAVSGPLYFKTPADGARASSRMECPPCGSHRLKLLPSA